MAYFITAIIVLAGVYFIFFRTPSKTATVHPIKKGPSEASATGAAYVAPKTFLGELMDQVRVMFTVPRNLGAMLKFGSYWVMAFVSVTVGVMPSTALSSQIFFSIASYLVLTVTFGRACRYAYTNMNEPIGATIRGVGQDLSNAMRRKAPVTVSKQAEPLTTEDPSVN